MTSYIADQSWSEEASRLRELERALDGHTLRYLQAIGVEPGMCCLEIGAGSGSVARWFAERVGAAGHVVATDLDLTLLTPLAEAYPQLCVRREDIAEQVPTSPRAGGFDVVHARLVLGHIPHKGRALRNIAAALRPGGAVLIEDADFLWSQVGELPMFPRSAAEPLFHVWRAVVAHMETRGYAVHWGRDIAAALQAAGFEQVRGEAVMALADPALQHSMRLTIARFAPALVQSGVLLATEVESCLATLADPTVLFTGSPTFSVWGRRPLESRS